MGGAGRSLEAFGDVALRLILWRSCPQRSPRLAGTVQRSADWPLTASPCGGVSAAIPTAPITITMPAEQVDGLAAPG